MSLENTRISDIIRELNRRLQLEYTRPRGPGLPTFFPASLEPEVSTPVSVATSVMWYLQPNFQIRAPKLWHTIF